MKWTISWRRLAPTPCGKAFRERGGAGVRGWDVNTAMPRITPGDHGKSDAGGASLPGAMAPAGRGREDVLEVDEVPVLVVAGVEPRLAGILVGDGAPFPGLQAGADCADVGAGPQFHIDIAVLAAPAFEPLRRVGIVGDEIDADQAVDLEVRVAGQIAQDAGDVEVAVDAAGDQGHRPADHVSVRTAAASNWVSTPSDLESARRRRRASGSAHLRGCAAPEKVLGRRTHGNPEETGSLSLTETSARYAENVPERLARR